MSIYYKEVQPEAVPENAHGRYIYHDIRSEDFTVSGPESFLGGREWPPGIRSVLWEPHIPAMDQGTLGSCTGHAMAHVLASPARGRYGPRLRGINREAAELLYSGGTYLDSIPGTWPPVDTGGSGLGVMKYCHRLGFVRAYQHAFSLPQALIALQWTPVIMGLSWREDMYRPDRAGLVSWSGPVTGGHEVALIGCSLESELMTFRNSWGPQWGLQGNFSMTFEDFEAALADFGDVVVPVW